MENLIVALVGATGVVIGALVAVLGTMVAEKQRHKTAQQQWQLSVRRDTYWQLMEASRLMRNAAYQAIRLGEAPDPKPKSMLAEAVAKAELVVSQRATEAIRKVRWLAHEDYYAAQPFEVRAENSHVRYRAGDRDSLVSIEQWEDAREGMKNALRSDLGLDAVHTVRSSLEEPIPEQHSSNPPGHGRPILGTGAVEKFSPPDSR